MQTNWLRAGHGPRRPRRPRDPQALARDIVASLRTHPGRTPEQYTQQPEMLALVHTLLANHPEYTRREP